MPCFRPLQAKFSLDSDGKKIITFSSSNAKLFYEFNVHPLGERNLSLPCGKCIGCRLERSRQWAVRIMHEAQLHSDNCFVTLTFDEEHAPSDFSLDKKVMQLFMKRLRSRFSDRKIKFFLCGEYGELFLRPHYHVCLFNVSFDDSKLWSSRGGIRTYTSDILSDLWPYGHSLIGELTFDSAAYVARYCVKKVNGKLADSHYRRLLSNGETVKVEPEFSLMSLKPAIGYDWISCFGFSDVFNFDHVVIDGSSKRGYCKPPRYYDKFLESVDSNLFALTKEKRASRGFSKRDDNSFRRLAVKQRCCEARLKRLVRRMEISR